MKTFQKTLRKIHKMKKFREAPWYIVTGPTGSGKTTFLKNTNPYLFDSKLNIISTQHLPQSIHCWIGENAIFIEAQIDNDWGALFKCCKKLPIAGLFLMIDSETLHAPSSFSLEKLVTALNYPLPVQVIVTQSDKVPGFSSFVTDFSTEEREQLFGFGLATTPSVEKIGEYFNEWLTKLNQQLIWRIQQAFTIKQRAEIKDFPIALHHLKMPLLDIARQLLPNLHLSLEGIYFTSDKPEPFFIQTFNHFFQQEKNKPKTSVLSKRSIQLTLSSCLLVLGALTSLWLVSYQQNAKIIQHIASLINQPSSNNLIANQAYAKKLKVESAKLNSLSAWDHGFGLDQTTLLKNALEKRYQATTNQIIQAQQIDPCNTINACLAVTQKLINSANPALFNPSPTLLSTLQAFNQLLESLQNNPQAAFIFASQRMQGASSNDAITQLFNLATHLPDPFKNDITALAANSWQAILASTQTYINQQWSTQVWPVYQTTIANRYPIAQNADTHISLKDFAAFFGQNGTLDSFFNRYIKPFVDMNTWQWEQLNGKSLTASSPSLDLFIRGELIKNMFFDKSNAGPHFSFKLIPLSLSDNAKAFKLKYGNQWYTFQLGQAQQFTWPSEATSLNAVFMDKTNQFSILKETGPWALFKLIDQSTLTPTKNTSQYYLSIGVNHFLAKYELVASQSDNPFIPGVISQFTCPAQLLG